MHARPLLFCACLAAAPRAASASDTLRVQATLAELPRSTPCTGRTMRVLCRYRLQRLISGSPEGLDTSGAASLLVVQRCPEFARGPSRVGRGTAPPLRPGQSHLLELAPYEGVVDAPPEAASGRHFEALRTDLAPPAPRVAVVVAGPSGARVRLDFDTDAVTVGRASDSDVLLSHRRVALRQLRFEVHGDQVMVTDLHPGQARVNGALLHGRQALTHKDTVSLGPYSLNVSLFVVSETASAD